jgi:hypothetical protein
LPAKKVPVIWKVLSEYLPTSQTVSNWLIATFTFLLAYIGYITERPQVVVNPSALQNFRKGGIPREVIVFGNVGHQPAYSLVSGIAIAPLPYPLANMHLTEIPPNSIPLDISPTASYGRPAEFQLPITDADFDAIKEGKTELIYVWGTVAYKDFFGISHGQDFCFGFSGSDPTQFGLCSVERPRQYYGAEIEQEPRAEPIPEPPAPQPSR